MLCIREGAQSPGPPRWRCFGQEDHSSLQKSNIWVGFSFFVVVLCVCVCVCVKPFGIDPPPLAVRWQYGSFGVNGRGERSLLRGGGEEGARGSGGAGEGSGLPAPLPARRHRPRCLQKPRRCVSSGCAQRVPAPLQHQPNGAEWPGPKRTDWKVGSAARPRCVPQREGAAIPTRLCSAMAAHPAAAAPRRGREQHPEPAAPGTGRVPNPDVAGL